jgi:hypothetical protein
VSQLRLGVLERAKAALYQLRIANQALATQQASELEILRAASSVADMERECEIRDAALASAQTEYKQYFRHDRHLIDQLAEEEAYYAQQELLRFVLSGRYALIPINFANAMAGLPYMGWRQSFKRCLGRECQTNGMAYRTFRIIRSAVSRSIDSSESVIDSVRTFLKTAKAEADIIAELKKNWYYLRIAIDDSVANNHARDALAYRITAVYQKRSCSKTAVDLILEERERL